MKKINFPDYVRQELQGDRVLSDEALCSGYIRSQYFMSCLRVATGCTKSLAVIGKRYESCRKELWRLRKILEIVEVMRDSRKNGSDEIFFKKI